MKFLIRVDDVGWNTEHQKDHNLELFKRFYDQVDGHNVHLVLGVISSMCSDKEISFLKTLTNVEIALHGYEHSGESIGDSEFFNKSRKERLLRIRSGLDILKDFNVRCFIPPHNYYDDELIKLLKKCSIKYFTGMDESSIRYINDLVYIPTGKKLCEKSYQLLKVIDELINSEIDVVKGLTLHCTWEYQSLKNGNVKLLFKKLNNYSVRLDDIVVRQLPDYSSILIAPRLSYSWILDRVGSGLNIIDIGSKDSILPVLLASKGNNVTALDMIDYTEAHSNLMKQYQVQYNVVVMDARKLAYTDNSFDIVTSSHAVTCNMDEDYLVVKEAHRVLKPGGKFLVTLAFTPKESFHWLNRKDPLRVNNLNDIYERFIKPNNFIVGAIDSYYYDFGKNIGSWCSLSKANAICLELIKRSNN